MPFKDYKASTSSLIYWIKDVHKLDDVLQMTSFQSLSEELCEAVIDEGGKFAQNVLAPLNAVGDKQGSALQKEGDVKTPEGFKEAYSQFIANGWNGVGASPEYGGQGLPHILVTALSELWNGANMSFALAPMLTQGTVELLSHFGTNEQKEIYLPKLISGEWSGTMCLTEPQAGSDVGAVTSRATQEGEHYRIKGTKIYITYGEHDLSENIIHMVLARLPEAPNGIKGISLFLVPKILEDGTNNEVKCLSLEHKLGIHASPTAVMEFGQEKGAVGYLIGEPNQGIKAMFSMMNYARLAVGIEGIGIAEASYQQAKAYASERVQGSAIDGSSKGALTIDQHPDIKRTLIEIKSQLEAMRGLSIYIAKNIDIAQHSNNMKSAQQAQDRVDLLIPVIKSYATEVGFKSASDAMQIFGGMGYIEETGIAQYLRDSRIALIYEGTNGIQALDLVMRKLVIHEGRLVKSFIEEIDEYLGLVNSEECKQFKEAFSAFKETIKHIQECVGKQKKLAAFHAASLLEFFALIAGGYMMLKSFNAKTEIQENKEAVEYFLQMTMTNYLSLHKKCLIEDIPIEL